MMQHTLARAWPLAALFTAAASCGHGSAASPASLQPATVPTLAEPRSAAPEPKRAAPAPEPLDPPPSTESIGKVMAEHFVVTSWARDAVISGQLEPLRGPLTLLAEHRYESVEPGGWLPWVAQLQAAARLTANAVSVDAAAMGVATMARVCGECHVATGGGPHYAALPAEVSPRRGESFPERMGRHMWAAEQLWRGLTVPSDPNWSAGAAALRDAPAEMDEWLPESFAGDLAEVRKLGEEAATATELADRADLYGLLLATCADCHNRFIEHAP